MDMDWIIPDWSAPSGVRALVTTREGPEDHCESPFGFNIGTRCGDDPEIVARNRACLREVLALPSDPCWLRQVHAASVVSFPSLPLAGEGSPRIARAGEGKAARNLQEPEADAALTHMPGVVLAIQTADCLPVLFRAEDGSTIAAAHAGWRGLCAGVLEAAVAAMETPSQKIMAWLGPAIAAQSYEVGDEVRDAFIAHDPAAASAFTPTRPEHWLCDLYELAHQRLQRAGVAQISGGGFDTFTDSRLHSYRRDGARSGRMASLIWLESSASQ